MSRGAELRGDAVTPKVVDVLVTDIGPVWVWECPACGRTFEEMSGPYGFCPRCGVPLTRPERRKG